MVLKETFQTEAKGFSTGPSQMERPVYTGTAAATDPVPPNFQEWSANPTSQEELLARRNPGVRSNMGSQLREKLRKR